MRVHGCLRQPSGSGAHSPESLGTSPGQKRARGPTIRYGERTPNFPGFLGGVSPPYGGLDAGLGETKAINGVPKMRGSRKKASPHIGKLLFSARMSSWFVFTESGDDRSAEVCVDAFRLMSDSFT